MKKTDTAAAMTRADARAQASSAGIASGLVNRKTGQLVEISAVAENEPPEDLETILGDLAAAVTEIVATDRIAWDVIFEKMGQAREGDGLDNILLISPARFYAAKRCPPPARETHLCMAERNNNVGFFLSEARALFEKLDREDET